MVAISTDAAQEKLSAKVLYGAAALLVLLVLAGAIIDQWQAPVPEFSLANGPAPVIKQVTPGSAARQAGIQPGDLLLRIDGAPFDPSSLATFSQRFKAGQIISVEVRRQDQVLDLQVPLVPESRLALTRMILCLIIVLVWCVLGFLLIMRYFAKREARYLFLLGNLIAVSFAMPAFRFSNWYPLPAFQSASGGAAVCLAIPHSLQFLLNFPAKLSTPRRRALVGWIAYPVGLAAAGVWLFTAAGLGFLWIQYAAGALTFLCFLGCCYLLVRQWRGSASPIQARQVRLMLVGLVISVVPAIFLFALPEILFNGALISMPVGAICLLAGLLIFYFAAMGSNLVRIDQVLNRAMVYTILLLVVLLLLAGPVVYLEQVIPETWFVRSVIVAGMTLLVAIVFTQLRAQVERRVDRLFYGSWYDYPYIIETISGALTHSLTWSQLGQILTRQLPELMRLSGAWLVREGEPDPLPDLADQPCLQIPILFEDEPYATWILGPRLDGDEFTGADRRIVSTLAPEVDVALSNILLVEKLNAQLAEIRTSHESLTQMGHQLLRTRDDEQARLSRELHDGPLQELVGMNLQLGMLISPPGTGKATAPLVESLSELRQEVRNLMTDLRQVCAELRPPMLDTLGLSSALRALAEEWSTENSIPVAQELPPDSSLRFISGEVGLNLYRVAQESLNNIAHHASASQASLTLKSSVEEGQVEMVIRDNGCGFDPEAMRDLTARDHFGLAGMQERVALIGGQWAIQSAPGAGTTIQVTWLRPASPAMEARPVARSAG